MMSLVLDLNLLYLMRGRGYFVDEVKWGLVEFGISWAGLGWVRSGQVGSG